MSRKGRQGLKALVSMIEKQNWDLELSKIEVQRAQQLQAQAEEACAELDRGIHDLEERIRGVADKDHNLSLCDMDVQRRYLQEQRERLVERVEEKQRMDRLVDDLIELSKKHQRALRLYETLHERRLEGIELEQRRRESLELDEMWLQRRVDK